MIRSARQVTKMFPAKPRVQRFVILLFTFVTVGVLPLVPTVAAHSGAETSSLSQWHGILVGLLGLFTVGLFVILTRVDRVSLKVGLYGILFGILVTTIGVLIFEGLAPDPTYSADSMPVPRHWYQPLSLFTGILILILSFIIGWLRWPSRPRYVFLGMLMGFWVVYPSLLPDSASYVHPLGYAIVIGTPVLIGYILWKDARTPLRLILEDPVARRFGIGVGLVVAVFFLGTSGYLSFFWEEGAPRETTIVVTSVLYQLVMWPTLEVALPQIPLFVAVSPGVIIIVGLLSGLVGLNAAVIARYWQAGYRAGTTQSTAGTATIAGACTCGCCGPLVSQFAIVAASPGIAAPLYWLFIDSASPLSSLFIMASLLLFTGTLIYSLKTTLPSQAPVPAD